MWCIVCGTRPHLCLAERCQSDAGPEGDEASARCDDGNLCQGGAWLLEKTGGDSLSHAEGIRGRRILRIRNAEGHVAILGRRDSLSLEGLKPLIAQIRVPYHDLAEKRLASAPGIVSLIRVFNGHDLQCDKQRLPC